MQTFIKLINEYTKIAEAAKMNLYPFLNKLISADCSRSNNLLGYLLFCSQYVKCILVDIAVFIIKWCFWFHNHVFNVVVLFLCQSCQKILCAYYILTHLPWFTSVYFFFFFTLVWLKLQLLLFGKYIILQKSALLSLNIFLISK